ncbi:MAG: CRTAC1 family protein [Polyangiaceae bacterium]
MALSVRSPWVVLLGSSLFLACGSDDAVGGAGPTCDAPPTPETRWFVDRTAELGVGFQHHMSTDFCHITDTVGGPGTCVFDADGDDDLDVFFPDRAGHSSALYRNDGAVFTDITGEAGVGSPGDAIGCLAFDYDGDDDADLLVTNASGANTLYRNDGGRFADVSAAANLVEAGFSTSATAGDIDGDGDLDLFVGRLVGLETCPDACYLQPLACDAERNLLYVNQGDGTFVEEAGPRGLTTADPTLAALFFDEDDDGDLDLYVGNDMGVAFDDRLYRNDGSGRFTDVGFDRGYSAAGTDTMGVDVGDFDGDGVTDMVTTDFKARPTRLYRCSSSRDLPCSFEALPVESTTWVNWAVALEDFDGDGDLDVFQTSGDVFDEELVGSPNQLFRNDDGLLHFVEPTQDDALAHLGIHRGAAFGDLDGDLDVDVVVATAGAAPLVLENVGSSGHSILVDVGLRAAGAKITVNVAGRAITEQALIGGGYLGSSDPRVHFGLGEACEAEVSVRFLDGRVATTLAKADSVVVLRP